MTDSSGPARDLLELHPKVLGPRGFLGLKPSALGAWKVALPQNLRLQKDSERTLGTTSGSKFEN